jgi:hypothetical protein
MAGVTMRADLQRKAADGGGEGGEKAGPATAITIGRYRALHENVLSSPT